MLVSELATARTYSRKGGKRPGRILRGHTYDHNPEQLRCGGSIPTRFQRILMPRDSVLIKTSTRFNDQHFYKSLFNKDPGPGSYKMVNTSQNSESYSRRGYGNGFLSQENRGAVSRVESYPEVGPGKYEAPIRQCKKLAGKVFAYTGRKCPEDEDVLKLNIPFDENNPLNYVKPITLNVYLKPNLPGPGEYDPKTEVPGDKGSCCSAFRSATRRHNPQLHPSNTPGAGQYSFKSTFENYSKMARRTNARRAENAGKQEVMTYAWLGDTADIVNKKYPAKDTGNRTEIVQYGKLGELQKLKIAREKLQVAESEKLLTGDGNKEVNPSAAFVLDDIDRFGEAVRPKKPLDLRPGPGEYECRSKSIETNIARKAFVPSNHPPAAKPRKPLPGPAFYNPHKEPEKLSFHLNINKKWV